MRRRSDYLYHRRLCVVSLDRHVSQQFGQLRQVFFELLFGGILVSLQLLAFVLEARGSCFFVIESLVGFSQILSESFGSSTQEIIDFGSCSSVCCRDCPVHCLRHFFLRAVYPLPGCALECPNFRVRCVHVVFESLVRKVRAHQIPL